MQTVYKIILALCVAGAAILIPSLFVAATWIQVNDKIEEERHENP